MSDSMTIKTKELNMDWLIIAGVCAILTLTLTLIGLYYDLKGVREADTWKATFASNQSTAVIETARHWASGVLYYGVNQTSGIAKTTKYDIWWKKSGGSYNLEFSNGYCNANNTRYGEWYMHSPNGFSSYVYKLVKKTNLSTSSTMLVDLMLK